MCKVIVGWNGSVDLIVKSGGQLQNDAIDVKQSISGKLSLGKYLDINKKISDKIWRFVL